MTESLDALDLHLLELIQPDARLSADALGEAVGLSTASVHRRLKRMRKEGVIRSQCTVVDVDKIARCMTLIVSVEIGVEGAHLCEAFKKKIAQLPEVQQLWHVSGEMDFVLVMKVRDMHHYQELAAQAFFGDSNVRRFKTSIVLSEVKAGQALPLKQLIAG